METIERQAGTMCGCLAVRQARACGLSLQPISPPSALACDEQRYGSCSCRLWRYRSVMPLPLNVSGELYTSTINDGQSGGKEMPNDI